MSSPTKPGRWEAVLLHHGAVSGPIRLPAKDRERFIESFNQLYRGADMSLFALEVSPQPTDDQRARNPQGTE